PMAQREYPRHGRIRKICGKRSPLFIHVARLCGAERAAGMGAGAGPPCAVLYRDRLRERSQSPSERATDGCVSHRCIQSDQPSRAQARVEFAGFSSHSEQSLWRPRRLSEDAGMTTSPSPAGSTMTDLVKKAELRP